MAPQHLALPLRVNPTGAMGAVEQDSNADVAQSIALLLTTHAGERLSVPTYGRPAVLFGTSADTGALSGAIDRWEPRAGAYDLTVDTSDPAAPVVQVRLENGAGTTITAQGA